MPNGELDFVTEENLPSIRAVARFRAIQTSAWSLAVWGCVNIAAWWFISIDDWRAQIEKLGNPTGPGVFFLANAGLIIGCVLFVFAGGSLLTRFPLAIAMDGLSLIGLGLWNIFIWDLLTDAWLFSPQGYKDPDPSRFWIGLGLCQIVWGGSRLLEFNRVRNWRCSSPSRIEIETLKRGLRRFVQLPENPASGILKAYTSSRGLLGFTEKTVQYTGRILETKTIFVSNHLDDCFAIELGAMRKAVFRGASVKIGKWKPLGLGYYSTSMLQQWGARAFATAPPNPPPLEGRRAEP